MQVNRFVMRKQTLKVGLGEFRGEQIIDEENRIADVLILVIQVHEVCKVHVMTTKTERKAAEATGAPRVLVREEKAPARTNVNLRHCCLNL